MIYCEWCDRNFVDGEWLTFRLVNGTETPFHDDCWHTWLEKEKALDLLFGQNFTPDGVQCFRRRYSDAQVGL